MCKIITNDTQPTQMRTNIEIEDELIREALRVSGLETKRAAVEAGLRALIRLNKRRKILDLAGKVQWEGNLDESREGRFPPRYLSTAPSGSILCETTATEQVSHLRP